MSRITDLLTAVGVLVFSVVVCAVIYLWVGQQFLFTRLDEAETRITRNREHLEKRVEVCEQRLNTLVVRLKGEPTVDQDGLPGEDFWSMTPEEFEEWQRKLKEEQNKQ